MAGRALEAGAVFPHQAVRREHDPLPNENVVTCEFPMIAVDGRCGLASQIFRDQPEVPKRGLTSRAGRIERPLEAMADVIVYQRFLRTLDRALHGLKLLCNLGAGLLLLYHRDNLFEVAIGALQAPGNRGMWMVRHCNLLSSLEDIRHPPWGILIIA
jgi:hypothetical protein